MVRRGEGGSTVLFFIFCCHIVGFLFFCKGFLLKRVIIPEYTNCNRTDFPSPPSRLSQLDIASDTDSNPTSHQHLPSCYSFPRPFKRVVWVLIDALRYDFMLYDDTLHHPFPVHRNKVPFVRDILKSNPANARLFKFVADPPTSTMQRLKALTTGSLPTFIDVGSNFNSYAVSEDNLPWQARENGRNLTFMGDNTWLGLYPDGMLTKVFDYPSLNVQDLDTVDDGVIRHLEQELALWDADLVIGHMLGVDHVGHTYGPSHWTMGRKLTQVNDFLKHMITHSLDEDTVLFVFGDHGMTPTGDHGGETGLETDAALLVYSARPLFDPLEPSIGREVEQVDIVSTTALVLGLPIPFSNLGMVIPEVLLPYKDTHSERRGGGGERDSRKRWDGEEIKADGYSGRVTLDFLSALKTNAVQLHTYLITYAQYSGDFPDDKFLSLEDSFRSVAEHHQQLLDHVQRKDEGSLPSQHEMTQVVKEYVAYMKEVKKMCVQVWAKFDNPGIIQGILLLSLSVPVSSLMLLDLKIATICLRQAISPGLGVGLVLAGLLLFLNGVHVSFLGVLVVLLNILFACLLSLLAIFAWKFRDVIMKSTLALQEKLWKLPSDSGVQLLAVAVVMGHTIAMFSNSFTLYEADMLAFFIQSLVFCLVFRTLQVEYCKSRGESKVSVITLILNVTPHITLMVCVRLSKLFYACRDLQLQDGCKSTSFLQGLTSASDYLGSLAKWRLASSCFVVAAVPMALIVQLRRSKVHAYLSRSLRLAFELGLPVCVACVMVHWYRQSLPLSTRTSLLHWQHVTSPLIVYFIVAIIIVVAIVHPFKGVLVRPGFTSCEATLMEGGDGDSVVGPVLQSTRKLYEHAPRRRKVEAEEEEQGKRGFQVMQNKINERNPEIGVSPMAAVISILVVSLWVPLAMLLNDGIALSAFLIAVEITCALLLSRKHGQGISLEVCVLWVLLSAHSFFSLGHHATVVSLRFEAGFVGIHGEITNYNLPWAAVLVGLNTMASQILFGLGLPLLLLSRIRERQPELGLSEQLLPLLVSYSVLHSWKLLGSVMAASLHRRHLMVWCVFAPRYLFEGAFQVVSDVAVVLGFGLGLWLERLLSPTTRN